MAKIAGQAKEKPTFSDGELRELQAQQLRQTVLDRDLAIEKLKAEVRHNAQEAKESYERAKKALLLLKNLVNGLRSTDLDIPGYEDAMAFFVQEKMLRRGGDVDLEVTGDINVSFPDDAERIFKI